MSKRKIIVIIFILVFLIVIFLSTLYYKDKYKVSFETGTDEKLMTQYIKLNGKVNEPSEPVKEGYKFIEWQLNGVAYDFSSSVNSDIILSAKWIKEEYITINYDTESTYSIDSIKIFKGSSINNLPVAYKDGYEFIGWYLNDKLYEGDEVFSDTTLTAHYNKLEEKLEYKVGDNVVITGNYSSSAYGTDLYDIAIGWDRKILAIYENLENPYMVGNENGVTGFFKEDSIKLKSSD